MAKCTTVHDRYHIGVGDELDATDQTFRGALIHAVWLAKRTGVIAWMWDNMAHPAQMQEWKVTPDGHVTVVGYKSKMLAEDLNR